MYLTLSHGQHDIGRAPNVLLIEIGHNLDTSDEMSDFLERTDASFKCRLLLVPVISFQLVEEDVIGLLGEEEILILRRYLRDVLRQDVVRCGKVYGCILHRAIDTPPFIIRLQRSEVGLYPVLVLLVELTVAIHALHRVRHDQTGELSREDVCRGALDRAQIYVWVWELLHEPELQLNVQLILFWVLEGRLQDGLLVEDSRLEASLLTSLRISEPSILEGSVGNLG